MFVLFKKDSAMRTVTFRMLGLLATAVAAIVLFENGPVSGQAGPGRADPQKAEAPGAVSTPADLEMQAALDDETAARHAVAGLVEKYGRAENETERAELKSQLAKALGDEFVAQQKRRSHELDRVEAQLKKVRDVLRKRADERQSIVDKRLEQLVREAEGLGWSEPSGFPEVHPVIPGKAGRPSNTGPGKK
jgi:hypothetical protein